MTKRDWRKVDHHVPDPGAVINVSSEPVQPPRWTGPQEREKRAAELADERREREYRSKLHDIELAGPNSIQWFAQLSESRKREKLGLRLTTLDIAILKKAEKLGK